MAPEVTINYLAVIVAAIASMVIGMAWYSPMLFGKQWMELIGISVKDMEAAKKKGMSKTYALAFVSSLVMAYVLAHFVDYAMASSLADGAMAGFWVWLGFVATVSLSSVLWDCKPWKLYFINVGYHLVQLVVMGEILTLWV